MPLRRKQGREGREPVRQADRRWAFLSDTHIAGDVENNYRGHYPYRNLRETFEQIASDLPEGMIVTGDIARLTGQTEDYEQFKESDDPPRRPAADLPGPRQSR